MTKPIIPKKIPEKRPERIDPGIPVVPEKNPDYIPEPVKVPIKEPIEVSYVPYIARNTETCYLPSLPYNPNKKQAVNLSDLL